MKLKGRGVMIPPSDGTRRVAREVGISHVLEQIKDGYWSVG